MVGIPPRVVRENHAPQSRPGFRTSLGPGHRPRERRAAAPCRARGGHRGLRRALRTPPRGRTGRRPHALPQRRRRPGPGLRGLHAGAGAPSRGEGSARVPPGLRGHGGVAAGRGPRQRPHPHASGGPEAGRTAGPCGALRRLRGAPGGCRRGGPGLRLPPRAVAGGAVVPRGGAAPAPSGGSGGGRAAERRVRAGQACP